MFNLVKCPVKLQKPLYKYYSFCYYHHHHHFYNYYPYYCPLVSSNYCPLLLVDDNPLPALISCSLSSFSTLNFFFSFMTLWFVLDSFFFFCLYFINIMAGIMMSDKLRNLIFFFLFFLLIFLFPNWKRERVTWMCVCMREREKKKKKRIWKRKWNDLCVLAVQSSYSSTHPEWYLAQYSPSALLWPFAIPN